MADKIGRFLAGDVTLIGEILANAQSPLAVHSIMREAVGTQDQGVAMEKLVEDIVAKRLENMEVTFRKRRRLELNDVNKARKHELKIKAMEVDGTVKVAQEQTKQLEMQRDMVVAQEKTKQEQEQTKQLELKKSDHDFITVSQIAAELTDVYVLSEKFRNAFLSRAGTKAANYCVPHNHKVFDIFGTYKENTYKSSYAKAIQKFVLEAYDQEAKKYEGDLPIYEVCGVGFGQFVLNKSF